MPGSLKEEKLLITPHYDIDEDPDDMQKLATDSYKGSTKAVAMGNLELEKRGLAPAPDCPCRIVVLLFLLTAQCGQGGLVACWSAGLAQ